MTATVNVTSQDPVDVMNVFFNNYTPTEAQNLLWKWFVLSIKGEFKKLSPEDVQQFADFFERLQNLVLASYALQYENNIEAK
jgi:hypothetical protein